MQNPEDVQDIAQEVFLQVYKSLPNFKPQNFKGWIGKIAANKAIDFKRTADKLPRADNIIDLTAIAEERDVFDPAKIFVQKENTARIRKICAELPDVYQQTIVKFYFEGKSYEQIAQEDGISLKTVESRLYRARNMVRQRWGAEN